MRKLSTRPKSRKVAIVLALLATVIPIPIAGIHKFYLGQPLWGIIYLLLWNTPMPRIACAIDVIWYLVQGQEQFERRFNLNLESSQSSSSPNSGGNPDQVRAIAQTLRELEQLRTDGLMSEYEFEQKRRQLLNRIV